MIRRELLIKFMIMISVIVYSSNETNLSKRLRQEIAFDYSVIYEVADAKQKFGYLKYEAICVVSD